VFTLLLSTLWRRDLNKNIPDLIENGDRVKVFSQIPGERENNSKVEDGGLKKPIPEPVEDDSQKIQGGNGQGKSVSHSLDEFLKGFEGAIL
jgi:hypothetical protein